MANLGDMKTPEQTPTMQKILHYWYTPLTLEEIAAKLDISVHKVYLLCKRYKLPKRQRKPSPEVLERDPSPEEIATAAAGIRSSWSPTQELARRVGWKNSGRWSAPVFTFDSRNGNFSRVEDTQVP